MQYKKIISGDTIIEFHNNWLGEETVIVNGQILSKKSSLWGTHHHFSIIEKGQHTRYVLTTKVDHNLQVLLDLRRNGDLVQENIPVNYGTMPGKPKNDAKKLGITKLKDFDLEEAVIEFRKALDVDSKDPEIYFHMACAHSVLENTLEGFESLKKAVENHLPNTEMILNHDMLAYLRMHPVFEDFLNSNFTEYDVKLIEEKDKE